MFLIKFIVVAILVVTRTEGCHFAEILSPKILLLQSIQALQQTNSGRVRDQPGLLVPLLVPDTIRVWAILDVNMSYITAFASISSMALEIEALLFAVNRFRITLETEK